MKLVKVWVLLKKTVKKYGKIPVNKCKFSTFTDCFNHIFLFNNSNLKQNQLKFLHVLTNKKTSRKIPYDKNPERSVQNSM